MNCAYNSLALDEKSRRLLQFVIGNQQCEIIRSLFGIPIGTSVFLLLFENFLAQFSQVVLLSENLRMFSYIHKQNMKF